MSVRQNHAVGFYWGSGPYLCRVPVLLNRMPFTSSHR